MWTVYTVRKPDSEAASKYVAGYNECAAQVTQYLTSLETNADGLSLTDDARCCLLDHLANSLHHHSTAALSVSVQNNSAHVTAQATVDQSSAVYVISPQQVPVTSSTSPTHSQLRVLPATLSSGQLVLLLAGSSACYASVNSKLGLGQRERCDVIALQASDRVANEALRQSETERHGVNSQSESSLCARDEEQNTDDLRMWRPW